MKNQLLIGGREAREDFYPTVECAIVGFLYYTLDA